MAIPPQIPIPRIETVALECLKPNPRNARTHSKRQMGRPGRRVAAIIDRNSAQAIWGRIG
jgi:hypothetical protein